jgi:DNA segregation ATPase FtsK/SpoIIIE, S-DNA-T family
MTMIFEAISVALFGGIALKAHLNKNGASNDSKKLNKIFTLSGLNVKDGGETVTAQLVRKKNHSWGTEYRYRIPLGRSFKDYLGKLDTIQDGLNVKRSKIALRDLRSLKLDRNIIQSIRSLGDKRMSQRKEVELSYDGMLIIKVYDEEMTKRVDFETGSGWKVPIGVTRETTDKIHLDFDRTPHVVIGGATRYGKSNLINCIITALLLQEPENVRLHLIDLKGGIELCDYERLKQTVSIAYEPEQALQTLKVAYESMRATQEAIRSQGKKKVQESAIRERHFIIIDEVGELNPSEAVDKDEKKLKESCQKYMSQIARLGAGMGFHQILATQYPTGDVIPRQCKQNSDAKICFRVATEVASRVVLDQQGGEQLPEIKGRAIYQTADKSRIIQTPLINSEVIRQAIEPYNTNEVKIHDTNSEAGEDTVEFEETGLS